MTVEPCASCGKPSSSQFSVTFDPEAEVYRMIARGRTDGILPLCSAWCAWEMGKKTVELLTPPLGKVHRLHQGRTPCGMPGLPKDWPPGNVWTTRWFEVTCPECLKWRPTSPEGASR